MNFREILDAKTLNEGSPSTKNEPEVADLLDFLLDYDDMNGTYKNVHSDIVDEKNELGTISIGDEIVSFYRYGGAGLSYTFYTDMALLKKAQKITSSKEWAKANK